VNSQNIGLLEANVSSATIIQDKKDKNSKDEKKIDENKDINIVSDSTLMPETGPAGVSDGTDYEDFSSDQISVYVVREGDSIAKIAEMFDVSANTILWTNDKKKGDKLVKDEVLLIFPVDGAKHTVKKGQTLKSIATLYKVDVSDITSFNGIDEDAKLAVGDELFVPDGEITEVAPVKKNPKAPVKDANYYKKYAGSDLGGYFINPVPEYKRLSQHIHGKNGVDLAAPTGTPIVAAASGKVIFAREGSKSRSSNGGYGGLTIVSHPNGTQTLYAHQSKIYVHSGEQVSQGQVIGLVGNTGHSTGPHLHYEVKGAMNNANKL
jgi:LysM repeat protein